MEKDSRKNQRKKEESCSLFRLFAVFFKVGLFTIGGGMAMIPLIQDEMVNKKRWLSQDQFVDAVAVSQGLPGVIAINMATYTGFQKKGAKGAAAATAGVVLPSFIIIIAIIEILGAIGSNTAVNGALTGIKAAATALIIYSAYSVARMTIKCAREAIIAIVSFVLIIVFHVNAIYVIIGGIILGIVLAYLRKDDKK